MGSLLRLKGVGSWVLLLLPAFGLAELGAHEYFRHAAPTEEDWARLGPEIEALYHPGDRVTVVPSWGEPLLRQQLGARFFPLEVLARPDNDGLERAIVVSYLGQASNEFWSFNLTTTQQVGPFALTVYQNPNPERPKMRLIERVGPAFLEVFDGQSGDAKPCPFTRRAQVTTGGLGGNPTLPATRFTCGTGEPYGVAITTIDDEQFRPRRCIWAHPSPDGPLTLLFHEVPLGKRLVGHAGLPWLISRDGAGTAIEITASLAGERLGRHIVLDQEGFRRFEWNTRARENQVVDLELTISSESAQNRRLCFTLESR